MHFECPFQKYFIRFFFFNSFKWIIKWLFGLNADECDDIDFEFFTNSKIIQQKLLKIEKIYENLKGFVAVLNFQAVLNFYIENQTYSIFKVEYVQLFKRFDI